MARGWEVSLPADLAARALSTAREIATRLRDPDLLRRAVRTTPQQSSTSAVLWDPTGLGRGHPGLAILFAACEAAFPGEGWRVAAQAHLEVAAEKARARGEVSTSLFHGLAGVDFAALLVMGEPVFDELLLNDTEERARRLGGGDPGIDVQEFDVVSGLAGTGAYLLDRGGPAVESILEAFVGITRSVEPASSWYTPAHLLPQRERERHPEGRVDCGLAHGLPGPLALLALAERQGQRVEGARVATDRLAAWLVEQQVEDEWGANWPYFMPLARAESGEPPARAAWCYGAPGVARALWLAGAALDEPRYCELAVGAMEAVYRRPIPERRINSPTFCHGVSGLLQITLRFAQDTGLALFDEAAAALASQLLDAFEPDSVLGFRDLSPDGQSLERAGLVEGATGVALVLLAASAPVEPRWDRLFLLS